MARDNNLMTIIFVLDGLWDGMRKAGTVSCIGILGELENWKQPFDFTFDGVLVNANPLAVHPNHVTYKRGTHRTQFSPKSGENLLA